MGINLDDRAAVLANDPERLLDLVDRFPDQCVEAIEIAEGAHLPDLPGRPSVVLAVGMGGSAAGAELVRGLFEERALIPFMVHRDGTVPSYVGLGDLVFCVSYSGDTQETLDAYRAARKAGAKIVVVSSGGKLTETAKSDRVPVIVIPAGLPPRCALGYLTLPILVACIRYKLLPARDFQPLIESLRSVQARYSVEGSDPWAKELAGELVGKIPLIYAQNPALGPVANRWRCQINENAKHLAFHNAYPELQHNEIMGWRRAAAQASEKWVVVTLCDVEGASSVEARVRATEEEIGDRAKFFQVQASGGGYLEQALSLCYIADYVSLYLAALAQVDPGDISPIGRLKAKLAGEASL